MVAAEVKQIVCGGVRSVRGGLNQLPDIRADSLLVGVNCQFFSETHIEHPAAQFDSYVCNRPSPTRVRANAPAALERALAGTGLAPQNYKRVCQGVGGHLAEGLTAMALIKQILQGDIGSIAHLKVGVRPMHRCPDFVILVPLSRLYQFYGLNAPAFNNDPPLPVPVEVKSSRIRENKKRAVREALRQLVFYWWRAGQQIPGVVGYGIVIIFTYGNSSPTLRHCFLRPLSPGHQLSLVSALRSIDLPALRAAVDAADEDDAADRTDGENLFEFVESCLGGSDNLVRS